ncbi:hypothetical protein DFH28DRAFT_947388 [Melampsora americana]|nr:hypothetical protein DFH28DRAFT_947388 [Melampsora americana]
MRADTNDCQAAAGHMAKKSKACAMFKSCAVMTRKGKTKMKPQALKDAPEKQAEYSMGNMLSENCHVECPIARKKWERKEKEPKKGPNDDLEWTYLFFNQLEKGSEPSDCDKDVYGALENSPA